MQNIGGVAIIFEYIDIIKIVLDEVPQEYYKLHQL